MQTVVSNDPVIQALRLHGQDLLDFLSPRTRLRAAIVIINKLNGRPQLSKEEIDEIERRITAGEYTLCPAFTDSDGHLHLDRDLPNVVHIGFTSNDGSRQVKPHRMAV